MCLRGQFAGQEQASALSCPWCSSGFCHVDAWQLVGRKDFCLASVGQQCHLHMSTNMPQTQVIQVMFEAHWAHMACVGSRRVLCGRTCCGFLWSSKPTNTRLYLAWCSSSSSSNHVTVETADVISTPNNLWSWAEFQSASEANVDGLLFTGYDTSRRATAWT